MHKSLHAAPVSSTLLQMYKTCARPTSIGSQWNLLSKTMATLTEKGEAEGYRTEAFRLKIIWNVSVEKKNRVSSSFWNEAQQTKIILFLPDN